MNSGCRQYLQTHIMMMMEKNPACTIGRHLAHREHVGVPEAEGDGEGAHVQRGPEEGDHQSVEGD
jgi:hypothetical protein